MVRYDKVASSFGKFFNQEGLEEVLGKKAEKRNVE
jgi:hypothetical protein